MVLITPDVAADMLSRNTDNFRPPDHRRVDAYSKEMAARRWESNGETIKFKNGILIDGQHRLLAIIKSGVSIMMIVVHDIEGSGLGIDRGKPRKLCQWLSRMDGVKNASTMAAAARLCVGYKKGIWCRSMQLSDCTDSECIDFVANNRIRLGDCVTLARKSSSLMPSAALAAVVFCGTHGDLKASENRTAVWFCERLADGQSLTDSDAVFHLRNTFLKLKKGASLSKNMVQAYLAIAWNRTARGLQTNSAHMRITMTGPNVTKLPDTIELMTIREL